LERSARRVARVQNLALLLRINKLNDDVKSIYFTLQYLLEKQDIIILRLYKMETPIGENRIN
jgi:hypothetical protein